MEFSLEISCQEVKAKLDQGDDLVLLDCREREEHAVVAINNAVLLPMSEIQQRIDELKPHRERAIVIHCHHGMRSAQVATWLRSQGFEQAQSMAGGIDAWALIIDTSLPRY